jgi:TRAP transporter TAXI family solute receptor
MPVLQTIVLRKWLVWTMFLVLVASLAVWQVTRDRLPRVIRIATGPAESSLYHGFCECVAPLVKDRAERPVQLVETQGSSENICKLLHRRADVAVVQGDVFDAEARGSNLRRRLSLVAPLYPEPVHVIARKELRVQSISDLNGRTVYRGAPRSGMRRTADRLLEHYAVQCLDPEQPDPLTEGLDFVQLLQDGAVDAAIVTTGVQNPALKRVLLDDRYELVPVREAKAIASGSVYFNMVEIPQGLYCGAPLVPPQPIETIATTAFLAAREDVSDGLVSDVLQSLHEEDLPLRFPALIHRSDALDWTPVPLHPVARSYFNPIDRISWLASIMESLAATKELLFAFFAGTFLLWDRWRRVREKERHEVLSAQKEHLDAFLQQTLRIEKEQMHTSDPEELGRFYDDVTRIKLEALQELTDEDLRGDQTFAIFLMQCANLISKIQAKIDHYRYA